MEYPRVIYQVLYPNPSLIASQLNPEQFARHYIAGSTRYYNGRLIFAEVDADFRHPFFNIEAALADLKPHEDGRPKATKFISTYRVLEHVSFDALKGLYLTTPEGYCLKLTDQSYDTGHTSGPLRIIMEITPQRMLVLSKLNFIDYAAYITNPQNPKGAPRFFYTQLDLDVEEFLEIFERNPIMVPPIPTIHPSRLRDAIYEMRALKEKRTKGLSLDSAFDQIPYKLIHHGFMLAARNETKFYPVPSLQEIEKSNYKFWRSM